MDFLSLAANVSILVGLVIVASAVEAIAPFMTRPKDRRRRANLILTLLTFAMNGLLAALTVLAATWIGISHPGFLENSALSPPMLIVITIVALDLTTYLAHALLHKVPFLWRIHRVHHSDPFVDATTTFRQHPLEGLWRYTWLIVPIWLLGLPAFGFAVYRIASAINAVLEHTNISIGQSLDQLLSLAWVTPNMHKVHHSYVQSETDSNYGNLFAVWDRMFRTFTPTNRAASVTFGLAEVGCIESASAKALLTMPARKYSE